MNKYPFLQNISELEYDYVKGVYEFLEGLEQERKNAEAEVAAAIKRSDDALNKIAARRMRALSPIERRAYIKKLKNEV